MSCLQSSNMSKVKTKLHKLHEKVDRILKHNTIYILNGSKPVIKTFNSKHTMCLVQGRGQTWCKSCYTEQN